MPPPDDTDQLRTALEQFVDDNLQLERLEATIDTFNPFDALQWTRQELRHSAFLRWLLDPTETHGLGPYFLTAFWKKVARYSPDAPVTVIDVDSWDMARAAVMAEWQSIDVLVQDDANAFIGVIENKVDTSEHSGQLQRYRRTVERAFPQHRALFAYLSPDGHAPSDDHYVAINYTEIVGLIEDTLERRREQLAPDVASFLQHYSEMVRRHIMDDSEVQQLCRVIYEKHRRALDLIFEHRPDRASMVKELLLRVIAEQDVLESDHSIKTYIRFISQGLDGFPRSGEGWVKSGRLLLIELTNTADRVTLKLVLGPGDQSHRTAVHQAITAHPEVFNKSEQTLYPKWWTFHTEPWLTPKQYRELDEDGLLAELRKRLVEFVRDRLPRMEEALAPVQDALAMTRQ